MRYLFENIPFTCYLTLMAWWFSNYKLFNFYRPRVHTNENTKWYDVWVPGIWVKKHHSQASMGCSGASAVSGITFKL